MIVESYQDLLKRSPIVLDRNGAKSGLHQDAVTEVVPWYREVVGQGDEIGPTPNHGPNLYRWSPSPTYTSSYFKSIVLIYCKSCSHF